MDAINEIRSGLPEVAKDIKLNLQSVLTQSSLDPQARWGVALAAALTTGNAALIDAINQDGAKEMDDATREDAKAAAVLMGMNNVYYRFRHMVGKETYSTRPARLRMNRMARTAGDKLNFELMSLAVSAINGCESCIQSHEKVVIAGGMTEDQVHDAVRIAATLQAASIAMSL